MLFLLLEIGSDRYALEADRIVEVLPLVAMKGIPHAARGVAGAFDYHGTAVPVIDLSELALGRAAPSRLSTRVIVTDFTDAAGGAGLLGLIAERATETVRLEAADFADFGLSNGSAPYLGPVTRGPRGLIQRIDVDRLLPQAVRDLLFAPGGPA
jgi:chemotaxis-related protein WspB